MKRRIVIVMICALMLSGAFLLTACNNEPTTTVPPTDQPPTNNQQNQQPPADDNNGNGDVEPDDDWVMAPMTRLIMATGGVAGTYYPLGGAMAAVINNITNLQINANASGASVDNMGQLFLGDADIALAQNDIISYALNGTEIWEVAGRQPVTNLATLMTLYPETIQIIVEAGSGIYSVDDLVGRRVSVGDIGSGTEANAMQILNAHGITSADFTVINLGFGPSSEAMRDGNIDAAFITAATPNPAVLDLSTARDLRILPLSDAAIRTLMNTYAFYAPITVTNADYEFVTDPVQTVAVQATLVTTMDLDEQVAYDIVRALIENAGSVGHARGAYITPENAVRYLSAPLHPGAERFFREIGAIS